MTEEIFKPIPEYEGFYEASNFGRIKSLPRGKKGKSKILKQTKIVYYTVDLCKNGIIKRYLVHRLIAKTFLENKENKENKKQVNHIDGNKLNNLLTNLEWATRSENQLHSIKAGLRTAKGIKNSQCKLKESEVIEIYNSVGVYKDIAKKYNVSIITISDIKRGRSWKHLINKTNESVGN